MLFAVVALVLVIAGVAYAKGQASGKESVEADDLMMEGN